MALPMHVPTCTVCLIKLVNHLSTHQNDTCFVKQQLNTIVTLLHTYLISAGTGKEIYIVQAKGLHTEWALNRMNEKHQFTECFGQIAFYVAHTITCKMLNTINYTSVTLTSGISSSKMFPAILTVILKLF